MAGAGWHEGAVVSATRQHRQAQRGFFATVYRLLHPASTRSSGGMVGYDERPSAERIRFRAAQHLGFAGNAIESVQEQADLEGQPRYQIDVNFMGLTGPSGALPRHYSEWMLERSRNKDHAMRAFFDLFNHRLISLFYRAWEKYRAASHYRVALGGKVDAVSQIHQAIAPERLPLARLYPGLFMLRNRSAQGLEQLLGQISGRRVHITQMQGSWHWLAIDEQTRLAGRLDPEAPLAQLGAGAALGQRVWDPCAGIQVALICGQGPVDDLLPNSAKMRLMRQVCQAYLGDQVSVRWALSTLRGKLPKAQLSTQAKSLGRGGCLLTRAERHPLPVTLTIN